MFVGFISLIVDKKYTILHSVSLYFMVRRVLINIRGNFHVAHYLKCTSYFSIRNALNYMWYMFRLPIIQPNLVTNSLSKSFSSFSSNSFTHWQSWYASRLSANHSARSWVSISLLQYKLRNLNVLRRKNKIMNKDDTEYFQCFQSDFMFQRKKNLKGNFSRISIALPSTSTGC